MIPDQVIPPNVKSAEIIRFISNETFCTGLKYAICLSYSSKHIFQVYICFWHSSNYVFNGFSKRLWSVIKEHEKAMFKGLLWFAWSHISSVYLKVLFLCFNWILIRRCSLNTAKRELNGFICLEIRNCQSRDALFSIVPQSWATKKYLLNFGFRIWIQHILWYLPKICWTGSSTNYFSSSYAFLFSLEAVHSML